MWTFAVCQVAGVCIINFYYRIQSQSSTVEAVKSREEKKVKNCVEFKLF